MHKNLTDMAEGIKEEWKSFLSAVDYYVYYRNSATRIHDIIKQGLKVFMQIPNARSCSLFLLNQDTYEFEHKTSSPITEKDKSKALFQKLVNQGSIGNTLESASVLTHYPEKSSEEKDFCLGIPLLVPSGVLGIVIILVDYLPPKVNPIIIKICLLFGNLFASTIDNSLLFKHLNQTKEILEQKVAARTMNLAQSRRELNAILDSVHTGIMVIDTKTNEIIKTNPVAADMIRDNESNLIGKKYTSFLDFDDKQKNAARSNELSRNFESLLKQANGKLLPILRTVSMINLGTVHYRIESFLDLSERKKAEVALKEYNELLELKVAERTEDLQILVHKLKNEIVEREQAQKEILKMLEKEKELSDLKTKFVSMVSHEFRTPLTIIRSSAQLVEKFFAELTDDEKIEYLDRIIKTVDFMKDLIENVIFIGRSDTQKIKLAPSSINIGEFCTNVLNDFQLTLSTRRKINLKFEGTSRKLMIDSKLLRHIILNLVSNAVKYSPDDKPVEIKISQSKEELIIAVKDYGIGIHKEEYGKIFELFYRGKNVGSISGTGLGMSVILRSLEILEGTIEIESELEKGSTFSVTIPINKL